MYKFSASSRARLAQCDDRLQRVFNKVIEHNDCTIITGHRNEAEQNEMFRTGRSQVQYPDSRHNSLPSMAVDVTPCPIDWKDRERFTLFAGKVLGIAQAMGIPMRWGGDWDGDGQVKDNKFDDLVHFELIT